jgi:hypothetical protein
MYVCICTIFQQHDGFILSRACDNKEHGDSEQQAEEKETVIHVN